MARPKYRGFDDRRSFRRPSVGESGADRDRRLSVERPSLHPRGGSRHQRTNTLFALCRRRGEMAHPMRSGGAESESDSESERASASARERESARAPERALKLTTSVQTKTCHVMWLFDVLSQRGARERGPESERGRKRRILWIVYRN